MMLEWRYIEEINVNRIIIIVIIIIIIIIIITKYNNGKYGHPVVAVQNY